MHRLLSPVPFLEFSFHSCLYTILLPPIIFPSTTTRHFTVTFDFQPSAIDSSCCLLQSALFSDPLHKLLIVPTAILLLCPLLLPLLWPLLSLLPSLTSIHAPSLQTEYRGIVKPVATTLDLVKTPFWGTGERQQDILCFFYRGSKKKNLVYVKPLDDFSVLRRFDILIWFSLYLRQYSSGFKTVKNCFR